MNKYTYLLSDCYRNPSSIASQTLNHSFSYLDHRPQSISKPSRFDNQPPRTDSRLERLKREYSAFQSKKEILPLHRNDIRTNLLAINRTECNNQNDHKSLQNRLHNLISLGQRHEQALKEVDLQSKLKKISDKYSGKQEKKLGGGYQEYRRERCQSEIKRQESTAQPSFARKIEHSLPCKDQHRIYKEVSFSKLPPSQPQPRPQAYLPLQAQNINLNTEKVRTQLPKHYHNQIFYQTDNEVTRTSVKAMITDHLNQTKQQNTTHQPYHHLEKRKDKIYQEIPKNLTSQRKSIQNPLKSLNSNQENIRSMQKLSDLQQRIKSSIKPYLNI